ncbi:hypothetical protein [Vibrio parahaemolyticus]|uniref:hypothetical protein n=2 Tax=Vibrio parahaemolyticus TaxID=670 RepID=UPI00039A3461|nr:hypothetical protein [Vibrio parahaemolyticus]MBE4074626.1 hypothetical protein [Vibrio parahaemolyticus]MBE4801827.1 hypothetical protein [Vibrio parahaemolyticus]MCX8818327.1 hypothetical protein [Vibrio parahaemolyticus]MCZ5859982.1 hypothetical protein [Vibrio parahaemolyticus]MCZ6278759.1 hypothetical protein [Vibrio parahaemolyticus]
MAFTVRTDANDEEAIDKAKKYLKSTKKGELLLEAAAKIPSLFEEIDNLKSEVRRLKRIESDFERVKGVFKELVK